MSGSSDAVQAVPCPAHGVMVLPISQAEADRRGIEHGCPVHNEELRNRPDPSTMTRQERATELMALVGPLWWGLELMKARIDALVGRPVYTHELASPEYLEHEILQDSPPTLAGVMAKFPHDKPVIAIDLSKGIEEATQAVVDFIAAWDRNPDNPDKATE